VLGRETGVDVLPSQSERPFPLLVWQVLFVPAVVLGFHRDAVERIVRRAPGAVAGTVVAVALVAAYLRLHTRHGLDPLGLLPFDGTAWEAAHFHKGSLDPARIVAMAAFTAALYVAFRRFERPAERALGWLLLPLGRSSFYVFIMHVAVCLALASLTPAALGPVASVAVQLAALGVLWHMARTGFLFRWVPR
jgi:hypothetical protein